MRYGLVVLVLVACSDSDDGRVAGEVGLCDDGRDNDGDQFVDCADQDCWGDATCGDAVGETSDVGAETSETVGPGETSADTTAEVTPEVDGAVEVDGTPDTTSTCDPCAAKGSVKGRVCAPSEHVFVSDARVWVEGVGCDGEAFTIETTSGADGTYYLLDVPCGTHDLKIEKGSFSADHRVTICLLYTSDAADE